MAFLFLVVLKTILLLEFQEQFQEQQNKGFGMTQVTVHGVYTIVCRFFLFVLQRT